MMKCDVLEDIGLTRNEAHVYLAVLDAGLATLCDIKAVTKLHRSNIYDSIEGLKKKGLLAYILKDEKKYYEVPAPEELFTILREKEFNLNKIMPQLLLSKQLTREKSQASVFEGLAAIQKIFMNFLTYKEPIYAYGISKVADVALKKFGVIFHQRREEEKIPLQMIYTFHPKREGTFTKNKNLLEVRVLPQHFDGNVSTHVCNGDVVLILWSNTPFVVQIRNKQISESYKKYFEILWASAEKEENI